MKTNDLKKGKYAILSLAFLMMISVLNVITSSLKTAFPEASTLSIQLSVSCAGLTTMIVSFLTQKIYQKVGRRNAVIGSLILLIVSSLLVYFYHPSIVVIYIYSLIFGITGSLYIPAVTSAIIDFYDGPDKLDLLSKQSVMSSAGGMLFTFVIGFLANISWNTSFLVYLLAIPSLLLCVLYYPRDIETEETAVDNKKSKVSTPIIKYGLIALTFIVCFGVYMANISFYIAEKEIGTTALTGILSSVLMIGGIIGGALFKKMSEKLDNKIFIVSFALLGLCYIILANTDSAIVCGIASLLIGFAQGILMPQCMLAVSREIPQDQSVLGSAVICNIAPFAGNLLSPIIVTSISTLLFGDVIRSRFLMVAVFALLIAVIFVINTVKKGKTV